MTEPRRLSVCFVTNELYPLSSGGIGRMLFNFATYSHFNKLNVDVHFLIPPDLVASEEARIRMAAAFDGIAQVHIAAPLHVLPDEMAQLMDRASFYPWSIDLMWSTSYRYYRELVAIEDRMGRPFDVVEFPDFGGWAIASIEAKRAGLAFENTVLAARLHSTQGVISRAERFYDPSFWNAVLVDAERHLLTHADLVVGHQLAIIDFNAEHYDLSQRWKDRIVEEFPPTILDRNERTIAQKHVGEDLSKDFIFSSRLQQFKRPDLFIRAAIVFLERHPDYDGTFRLVSYGWDQAYIDWLQGLVPPKHDDQIAFAFGASSEQRLDWLSNSIVVVPSDYESLCLFAYEAGAMGRKVILNRRCLAFGEGKRWREGENCMMFDGSVGDLVTVMEQALGWRPTSRVSLEADMPYWASGDFPPAAKARAVGEPQREAASLGVFVHGIESHDDFERRFASAVFLESALDLALGGDELVFLIPLGLFDREGVQSRRVRERGWRVEYTSGLRECPESLRMRLMESSCDHVMLWPAGYAPSSDFIAKAKRALVGEPRIDVFGGHLEEADPATGRPLMLRVFGGEMPSMALTSSRVAPMCSVIRRSFLKDREFEPRAIDYWFETFVRDAALDGARIVIAPLVAATISQRAASRLETTKKLSAGIYDAFGIRSGLPRCRLLGIDPALPPRETDGAERHLPDNHLRRIHRIHPIGRVRDFEPVIYLDPHNGVMVHPLHDDTTIADLMLSEGRLSSLVVTASNVSTKNDGVQAALARIPENTDPREALGILSRRDALPKGYAFSAWEVVSAGTETELRLQLRGASNGRDRILFLTRLAPQDREDYAHLVFRNLRVTNDFHGI